MYSKWVEKSPLNKLNKIRKVASAAVHLASMDPLSPHSILKSEDHTAHINKKPEIEIAQVQPRQASSQETLLNKQLKKTTEDYFEQEVNRKHKGDPQPIEYPHYKDFRRSQNVEDRRHFTPEMEEKLTEEAQIKTTLESMRQHMPAPVTFSQPSKEKPEFTTPLAAKLGAADIEKADKHIKTEVKRKAAELDVKIRLGVATPEEREDRKLYP